MMHDRKFAVEFTKKLKNCVEINNKIHINRLNPHYKLNLDTKAKIRITPLGGLNEIGGNMTLIECNDEAIIVDVGMSFPSDDMPGVDILVPDFSYIKSIKNKIRAVIITHAHEDHIGAVPYLFKEMAFPLYGSPMALQMIAAKFDEHKLFKLKTMLHPIEKRKQINIGKAFKIEWIHITHSIVDCSGLAIETEAGTILHTGDFKVDHTPVDNFPTDIHRFAHYGEKGILVMLSDSTNSHKSEITKSEKVIGKTFDNIFQKEKGRLFMSTFSSNTHRIYQAIQKAIEYGRKVCIIGRSMEKNINIALDLGYIKVPKSAIVDVDEVNRLEDSEVLIITTGSQGENMSALYRISIGEHKQIKLQPEDGIILSSKPIPGNEGGVSKLINNILKVGAKVIHNEYSDIHTSGHASSEEQKLLLRLCKPKFFLPVHGEYNHIKRHRDTAIDCGVLEKNIVLMEDGDVIEVHPKYMKKVSSVKSGKSFIDNTINKKVDNTTLHDRQRLSSDGIVTITGQIDKNQKSLISHRINVIGLLNDAEHSTLNKDLAQLVNGYLKIQTKELKEGKALESDVKHIIKKHIFKLYKKYPIITIGLYLV